ncbi:MAG: MT-A70 family methyltransferase [Aeromonas sp.]
MKKYDVIHADPPWRYKDKSTSRGGAERHYGTMSLDELKAMNVADYAAKDCCLMMWTTGPQLEASIELMRSWGFKYVTLGVVWVKRTKNHWENSARRIRQRVKRQLEGQQPTVHAVIKAVTASVVECASKDKWAWGMGSWTRACAEVVLIGAKGSPASLRKDKGVHQVMEEVVGRHSAKPQEIYERIERLFGDDVKRLDMFTRANRPGWDAIGDQVARTDYIICPTTFQILPAPVLKDEGVSL